VSQINGAGSQTVCSGDFRVGGIDLIQFLLLIRQVGISEDVPPMRLANQLSLNMVSLFYFIPRHLGFPSGPLNALYVHAAMDDAASAAARNSKFPEHGGSGRHAVLAGYVARRGIRSR
jgi:hypothetical protein